MSSQVLRLHILQDQYRFVNSRRVFHWKSTDHDLRLIPGISLKSPKI